LQTVIIRQFGAPEDCGDLVLDAFLGSGASLIAAERIGRRFRGLPRLPSLSDVPLCATSGTWHRAGNPTFAPTARTA